MFGAKCWELSENERRAVNEYKERKGLPLSQSVTFGDLELEERYSDTRSRSVITDFSAKLSGGVVLETPFVSANMPDVTGVELATAMAREGGFWFLPQFLPLERRLWMLELIRRTDCAFIENPLTVLPGASLKDAKEIMRRYGVSGLILVENGSPVDILTKRDWKYETDDNKTVSSLAGGRKKAGGLIIANRSISFVEAGRILRENRIEKLPLVDESGKLAGLITANGLFYAAHHPRATRDSKGRFLLAGSVGVGESFTQEHIADVEAQIAKGISVLLIDTARGFAINMKEAITTVRRLFPELTIVAGNISSASGAKALFEWGADVVKVNQGRGHVCRTSENGYGKGQVTAIAEAKAIADIYGRQVMADGAMTSPGDCIKAIVAGADTLMSGFLFVRAKESAAPTMLNREGFPVKAYRGSASFAAQEERIRHGTLDRLRRPEGVDDEKVPVVGSLREVMQDLLDGFRSAMTMGGIERLADASTLSFKLQSRAGYLEGTKEHLRK